MGKDGYFKDLEEAKNKNADNETADLFSVLDQLEQFRTCNGHFHFKLCYPELAENFSFPCNEWTQLNNPVYDSIIRDFKPVKITFKSETEDFKGFGMSERGKDKNLLDDSPFSGNYWFSIGALKEADIDGKFPGPPPHYVGNVELYVNQGKNLFTNQ